MAKAQTKDKPVLRLTGHDGNAFFIIGRAVRALRNNGCSEEEVKRFTDEAMAGDYDGVLQACIKWFDVE